MREVILLLFLLAVPASAGEWSVTITGAPVCRTGGGVVVPCNDPLARSQEVAATVRDENDADVLTTTRVFPITMNGAAIKLSLRHQAWMTKYPEEPVSTQIVPGRKERVGRGRVPGER